MLAGIDTRVLPGGFQSSLQHFKLLTHSSLLVPVQPVWWVDLADLDDFDLELLLCGLTRVERGEGRHTEKSE